jgi:hypothetical protein
VSAAAITPNVKGIVVCDEAFGREIETGVYNLEGVRQVIAAPTFPYMRSLFLFMQIESARPGEFNGNIRIIERESEREIRHRNIAVWFEGGEPGLGYVFEMPPGGMMSMCGSGFGTCGRSRTGTTCSTSSGRRRHEPRSEMAEGRQERLGGPGRRHHRHAGAGAAVGAAPAR